jgi:C4-type Zn-finger protein
MYFTLATCPLCEERYRIEPWPLPNVPHFSRVVIDPPCGHRRFSLLEVELDVFKFPPVSFPMTVQIAEIRPPDPLFDKTTYKRRRANPIVQFE